MITCKLPVSRMDFREVLETALGLAISGHEKAAEQLVKRWAREVEE